MSSTFATTPDALRSPARAGVGMHALAIAMPMQAGVVTPPRSPGPGRP